MELKCKDGELALVIHDEPSCEENIGKVVQVSGPVEINRELQLPCWLIQPVHRNDWKVTTLLGEVVTQHVSWESRVEHPDKWLMPLRPQSPKSVWWEMQNEIDQALLLMGVIDSIDALAQREDNRISLAEAERRRNDKTGPMRKQTKARRSKTGANRL